jgi:hypothetical protein
LIEIAAAALSLILAFIFGFVLPSAAMRLMMPTLESSALTRPNYRGRRVAFGLGLVWVVWAVGILLANSLPSVASLLPTSAAVSRVFETPLGLGWVVAPVILVMVCVVLGLADDVFGTAEARGFRGHLRALAGGRLTTGGLKLLGIGVTALVYGAAAAAPEWEPSTEPARYVATWLLAALVIALSANLLNLFDLRPGRAIKIYALLVPVPAVALTITSVASHNESMSGFAAEMGYTLMSSWETAAAAAALLLVLLGPAAAVWRYDVGERAILGDAGSNAMGAVVGYLLTAVLSLPWLAVAAAILLAANLASERISFSEVIERTPVLRWFDGIGRSDSEASVETSGEPRPGDS